MMNRIKSSSKQVAKCRNGERGVALIIALFAVLLLSILGASILSSTQSEIWTNYNYRTGIQARYVAEAGAERAADWILNNYLTFYSASSNLPPFSTDTRFNLAAYPMQCKQTTSSSFGPCIISGTSSISSNFPDPGGLISSFASAYTAHSSTFSGITGTPSYSVALQLMSASQDSSSNWNLKWKIISQGTAGGTHAATVQVMETLSTKITVSAGLFNYGLMATSTGCQAVYINQGSMASYNSTSDPYASSQGTAVGIATPGGVSLVGSLNGTIAAGNTKYGYSYSAPPGVCTSSNFIGLETDNYGNYYNVAPTLYTSTTTLPVNPDWTTLTKPTNTACSTGAVCSSGASGTWTPSPGTYGNVVLGNGATITLQPGVYNFNSLSVNGGVAVTVVPAGSVTINIYGKDSSGNDLATPINFGNGSLTDSGVSPKNFAINYEGTGTIDMASSGGAGLFATIYAPNAIVDMENNNIVYGAVIAKQSIMKGSAKIVYDTTLASGGSGTPTTSGNFDGFSWSRY